MIKVLTVEYQFSKLIRNNNVSLQRSLHLFFLVILKIVVDTFISHAGIKKLFFVIVLFLSCYSKAESIKCNFIFNESISKLSLLNTINQLKKNLIEKFKSREYEGKLNLVFNELASYPQNDQRVVLERLADFSIDPLFAERAFRIAHEYSHYDYSKAINSSPKNRQTLHIKVNRDNLPGFTLVPLTDIETPKEIQGSNPRYNNEQFVFESYKSKIYDGNTDIFTPGLSLCSATFIFNLETGRIFVFHSSMGIEEKKLADIALLGAGRKVGFVIGARSGEQEAGLFKNYLGIPMSTIQILNANSHINVRYSSEQRSLLIGYSTFNNDYYLGTFKIDQ